MAGILDAEDVNSPPRKRPTAPRQYWAYIKRVAIIPTSHPPNVPWFCPFPVCPLAISHQSADRDKRKLLLCCGDVEENPGPAKHSPSVPQHGLSTLWNQRTGNPPIACDPSGMQATDFPVTNVETGHPSPSPKRPRTDTEGDSLMAETPGALSSMMPDSVPQPGQSGCPDKVSCAGLPDGNGNLVAVPPPLSNPTHPNAVGLHPPSQSKPVQVHLLPKMLPSLLLLETVQRAQGAPVDIHIFGDDQPDGTLPIDLHVFGPSTHSSLTPSHLQGHHSLFLFPRSLPFKDSPPLYSIRSWCALITSTLQGAGSKTLVTVVLASRFTTPHLPSLPLLDRRMELGTIRRFLTKVIVLPDTCLNERCTSTGAVAACRQPPATPLLLFAYRGGASFETLPPHAIWHTPREDGKGDVQPPMEAQAFHVLMNYETPDNPEIVHPVTSLRFLMALNALGAEETSLQFKLATTLNYPATVLPHIRSSAPEGITIDHMDVGAAWLERLQNERELLLALGFNW